MKWSVQQLNKMRHSGLIIDEMIDLSEMKNEDNDIRDLSPVQVKGEAVFTGSKVTFRLNVSGAMILPCSRTLADVEYPFQLNLEEMFDLNPSEYELEDHQDEVHPVTGETLDLIPHIRENILLEIPMQIFSENPEEGLAPQAGPGWEVLDEKAKSEKIDPRLAELKKFFNKEDE